MAKEPIDPHEYVSSGKHLPPFLRDFHAQKNLFQLIAGVVAQSVANPKSPHHGKTDIPGWRDAHVYVIDFFLWFMAQRGWTLQRSRANVRFADYDKELAAFGERQAQELANVLGLTLIPGGEKLESSSPAIAPQQAGRVYKEAK